MFVEFVWQFCSKKEYRLIFGKVLYSTVTKLHFKQLIQTATHKRRFHVHFFKFPVTAIYQSESRTASRSAWHIIRQLLFLSAWDPFVICQPFKIIFSSHRLRLRAAISIKSAPQSAHLDPNPFNHFSPVAHSTCLSAFRNCKHSLWTVCSWYISTFDSDCHTFSTGFSLNIYFSKFVDFAFFVELNVR